MASELSVGIQFTFAKDGAGVTKSAAFQVTISGSYHVSGVQNVGTSDETIALGDIATNGWCYFKNLDSTNFVTLGADGSSYPIKLKAGEAAVLRWNGAAVHVKADTASCKVEYGIIDN